MSRRPPVHAPPRASGRWRKFLRVLIEIQAVWHIFRDPPRLLILCGRFPDDEEAKDGFFQRVLAVDRILSKSCPLYLEVSQTSAGEPLTPVGKNGNLLRLSYGLSYRLFVHFSQRISFVYYHSSLSAEARLLSAILNRSRPAVIWDLHGAVPEELEFLNKFGQSQDYARIEKILAKKATAILCVTSAMKRHVIDRHKLSPDKCIVLPIVPNTCNLRSRARKSFRFVYAGGTQPWQGISAMVDAITQTPVEGQFYFFLPTPNQSELRRRLKALATPTKRMVVATRSPPDVRRELCSMGFGFCLRTDHIFNRVAFPTKLAEYVAAGVVPILSYADIGGLVSDGLRYVPLSKFIAGELPSDAERQAMAEFNYGLLEAWRCQMSSGAEALTQLITSSTIPGGGFSESLVKPSSTASPSSG